MLGIGLGLGCWLTFMLAPLIHYYDSPMDPQVGSVLVLLYPLAIGVRHRALSPLRRHRGDPPLGGLHDAGRPHHRRVRAAARRGQCARGPGGLDALAVVLGGVHVRRGPLVQPAPRMGAAGGRSHLLPRALRLRADHPGAGPLHGEPARPRRDHAPAHDDHRVGHARPLGAAPARRAACRHRRRPPGGAGRAVALPARRRPALRPGQRARARRLRRARRRGRRAAPIPGRARGAPGAGPEALGGGLHRRRPRAARDGGRPGGGGGRQCRGAPARARLCPGAGAEPHDPHQPRQVRPAARAPAHRGVAGGAVARQARDGRDGPLRRHHRLYAAHRAPGARTISTRSSSATSAPSSTRSSSTAATSTRRRATGSW